MNRLSSWFRRFLDFIDDPEWIIRKFGYRSIPTLLSFFIIVGLIIAWPLIFVWLWPYLQSAAEFSMGRILIVCLLVMIAGCLFTIRAANQSLYGIVEIIIGIVGCWGTLKNLAADRITVVLALATSVYIIVRGLVNIREGRDR